MKKVIQVKDLIKRYKKATVNAVDRISFEVDEGEFFAFLGPNGAGKTTTISILTTTLFKTSGEVSVAGFDIDRNQKDVRQSIGVIFQNPSLDLNLTAEENIRFHSVLYGLYPLMPTFALMPKDYKDRIYDLAEVLDIKNDIFKPIRTFSGGMRRKLEIIRSLMHHPKVLFLDEPSSGLDPLSRKNLWEYLKEVRKREGTTIFLTTHYLDEAEGADRVCIVNHGKIVSNGTPDDIKKELIENYVLIGSKERDNLRSELQSLNIKFEEDGLFKINAKGEEIYKMIKSLNTPLDLIKTYAPSLEEAYIKIIDPDESH